MEGISNSCPLPSSMNSGTMKSCGVSMVSATMARMAGVLRKMRLRLCRYIFKVLFLLWSFRSQPFPRMQAGIQQFGFRCFRRRMIIVTPARAWRQAHQDAFRTTLGLQAKEGPTVMDQVEFHIAPPPDLLPFFFPFAIRHILSFQDDGGVSGQKCIPAGFLESQQLISLLFIRRPQMIIEDAANASHFVVTVFVDKIFIAPLLVPWIFLHSERLHGLLEDTMKMPGVFFKKVIRSKI